MTLVTFDTVVQLGVASGARIMDVDTYVPSKVCIADKRIQRHSMRGKDTGKVYVDVFCSPTGIVLVNVYEHAVQLEFDDKRAACTYARDIIQMRRSS